MTLVILVGASVILCFFVGGPSKTTTESPPSHLNHGGETIGIPSAVNKFFLYAMSDNTFKASSMLQAESASRMLDMHCL